MRLHLEKRTYSIPRGSFQTSLYPIAQRHVEAIREAVDWREANCQLYRVLISDLVSRDFHKTIAFNPNPTPNGWAGSRTLDAALQILLTNHIVKGEKIRIESRQMFDRSLHLFSLNHADAI